MLLQLQFRAATRDEYFKTYNMSVKFLAKEELAENICLIALILKKSCFANVLSHEDTK